MTEQIHIQTPCKDHSELISKVGSLIESNENKEKALDRVFDNIERIKEYIVETKTRIELRDMRIESLCSDVKNVDTKIENGLRSEVRSILNQVATFKAFIDQYNARIADEVQAAQAGVRGAVRRGLLFFVEKGVVVIVLLILLLLVQSYLANSGIILKIFS